MMIERIFEVNYSIVRTQHFAGSNYIGDSFEIKKTEGRTLWEMPADVKQQLNMVNQMMRFIP